MMQCMEFKDGSMRKIYYLGFVVTDETTIRRNSYRFVSFFRNLIAGLIAGAEVPHFIHCRTR
jgi:hypothetical protein